MSVRTDAINLNVNINGNDAQNNLNNLKKKAGELKLEMEGLKKGTQEYLDKQAELKKITAEMSELKKQIGITALTQKELIAELNKLKALRGSVIPFSDEFKQLSKSIKEVENRLYDVKNGVQGFQSFLSKIKDEVKQFGVMAVGFLGFQFVAQQFQNIIQGAGKLSDSLADIRRVSGLTAQEANHLNKELSDLDTRTSTAGLRNIAVVAGKLGVAKEEILGFVQATDKLVVALGDELGDADQITTQLGKIIGVFDQGDKKVTGEKLTHIGNAIVDLANKGVASGGFIVDFTQRLGGMADIAHLALPDVMGLAAGLEESGQKTESSSTAIIKVLGQIGKDAPKFAKVAGISIEEFSKILREKPVEALIKVSEGFTKGKNGLEEISKAFQDAGEDGAKIVTTLGVIGGRADFFRQKVSDAGVAMRDTNEINDAFALKNETLGATLDKLGKEFNKMMTSSAVTNFLKSAVEGSLSFIKAMRELPQWLKENQTALYLLIAGIALLNAEYIKSAIAIAKDTAAKIINTVVDKAALIASELSVRAKMAQIIITELLTKQITFATAAQQFYNYVMAASLGPLGIIIALVSTAVIAYNLLAGKTKLSAEAQQRLNIEKEKTARIDKEWTAIQGEVVEQTSKTIISLRKYEEAAKDVNKTDGERKAAIAGIIAINPEYFKGIDLESVKTGQLTDKVNEYIEAIGNVARAKAIAKRKEELLEERLKEEEKRPSNAAKPIEYRDKNTGKLETIDLSPKSKDGTAPQKGAFDIFDKTRKQVDVKIAGIDASMQFLDAEADKLKDKIKKIPGLDNELAAVTKASEGIIEKLQAAIKAKQEALPKLTSQGDINKNLAETKKLQEELDHILGKKTKEDKKGESEFDKLKKEAKQFEKDIQKFRKEVEVDGASADQKEIVRIQQKYDELKDRALKYFKANVTDLKKYNEEKTTLEELFNTEMKRLLEKNFEKSAEKEYDESLKLSEDYFAHQKNLVGKSYADGIIDKKEYEKSISNLEQQETDNRIWIANDYVKTVKKASADLTKFKQQQEKDVTKNEVKEHEDRVKYEQEESLAKSKLAVITSPKNSDRRLQAEKDLLLKEFEIKTAAWDKESEQYKLAVEERIQAEQELQKQATLHKIEEVMKYVGYFQQALGSLNSIITNRENRMLAEEKKRNDQKKTGYKNQLDSKLMNQAKYDQKIKLLDEEQAKHEAELKRKQAERSKALNLFNAIISNAAAIVETMTSVPYPFNIPLAIAQGIAGGLQVAAIANEPLPELGSGAWVRDGDKHSDSSGGINAKIERDEAVMKAAAMTNPKTYTVTGTTAQITSALNAEKGGVSWAGGAIVDMMQWLKQKPASINPGMVKIMEQGGVVRPINQQTNTGGNTEALLQQLIQQHSDFKEEITQWQGRIHTMYTAGDVKKQREIAAIYDAARKSGSIS